MLLELCGGVALMLGLFVLPLSLPLAAIMLTAMFSVHVQYGFSSIKLLSIDRAGAHFGPTGYEINLLYLAGLLTLALSRLPRGASNPETSPIVRDPGRLI